MWRGRIWPSEAHARTRYRQARMGEAEAAEFSGLCILFHPRLLSSTSKEHKTTTNHDAQPKGQIHLLTNFFFFEEASSAFLFSFFHIRYPARQS